MSVSLSLKGVPPGKIDVFLAPDYIKVNFAPFLFEAFLAGEIVVGDDEDKESGRQLFDAGRIILQFKKTREGIWSDGPCKKKLRLSRTPNIIISKLLTIQSSAWPRNMAFAKPVKALRISDHWQPLKTRIGSSEKGRG